MPAVVSVAGRELQLNGMGVPKEKVLFKVYTAWLYLEEPTADAQAVVAAEEAKRLVIVMLRDVSREQSVQAVEKGVARNSGPMVTRICSYPRPEGHLRENWRIFDASER